MSYLPRTLVLACALASTSAFANDTITFEGEITDQTCDVMINGQAKNATVMLPTVSMKDFAKAGDVAGLISFDVDLSNCVEGAEYADKKVSLSLYGKNITTGGAIKNTATAGAKGVAVEVLTSETEKLVIGENHIGKASLEFKSGTQKLYARYVADFDDTVKAVAPGKVTAVAEYTLSYL